MSLFGQKLLPRFWLRVQDVDLQYYSFVLTQKYSILD